MPELHLTCPVCQTHVDKDYPTHLNSKTQAPLVRELFEGSSASSVLLVVLNVS